MSYASYLITSTTRTPFFTFKRIIGTKIDNNVKTILCFRINPKSLLGFLVSIVLSISFSSF